MKRILTALSLFMACSTAQAATVVQSVNVFFGALNGAGTLAGYGGTGGDSFASVASANNAQTITWNTQPAALTYPATENLTNATASSSLPITYSTDTTTYCTVSGSVGSQVLNSVNASGNCVVHADQAGNGTYAAAPRVDSGNVSITAGGGGDPTFVQGRGITVDNSTSFSYSTASNVTSGNLLVVAVHQGGATWTPAVGNVSKSAGTCTVGAWLLDTSEATGTSYANTAIYSAPITGAGTCTVAVTTPSGSYGGITVYELGNVNVTASRVDTPKSAGSSTGSPSSGSFNTSMHDAIVAVMSQDAGGTNTINTNYTQIYTETDSGSHQPGASAYRLTTGALTGETANWTAPTSGHWAVSAVAYKGL